MWEVRSEMWDVGYEMVDDTAEAKRQKKLAG